MLLNQRQLTDQVVMVRPSDFGFNEQTAHDNQFQTRPSANDTGKITEKALLEFDRCVSTLQRKGISVEVLEKFANQQQVPDAVFPNNWFSTRCNGDLIIYPMKTENRQAEIQVKALADKLATNFNIGQVIDLREKLASTQILEGTGSLVFHHPSNQLFAAVSERCLAQPLEQFAEEFEYQLIAFDTHTSNGKPIYHTNVLMSCGENFSVITKSVVQLDQQKMVLDALSNTVEDLIIISEQQMTENFCGNVLQLKNNRNDPVIVMSHSAYRGFNEQQKKALEKHGDFVIFEIPTIESIGGGSARCMIAENFLPRN